MNHSKTIVMTTMMLAILGVGLEAVFFTTGKILQQKWGMWREPAYPADGEPIPFEEYMTERDPVVGWPYPKQFGGFYDVNGAQWNPYFPDGASGESCVSLYGDSFTEGGDTTSTKKSWGNVLSSKLDCYIANFGTGGYGTDQAYLRFEMNRSDPSPIVIFGFHTGDVLRNLTRIRDLENYAMWYALKPRFIFNEEDDSLELVPIPDLTEDEYLRVLTVKGEPMELPHETLHPDGPAGVVKLSFPYTISVIRNLFSFYGFRARLFDYPEYMPFLDRNHELHGLEITVGITQKFVDEAMARNKQPLVVILPLQHDIRYFMAKGDWPYQNVVSDYSSRDIPFLDFGPYLLAESEESGRGLESYFGETGHYNDEGNALVAEYVFEYLTTVEQD